MAKMMKFQVNSKGSKNPIADFFPYLTCKPDLLSTINHEPQLEEVNCLSEPFFAHNKQLLAFFRDPTSFIADEAKVVQLCLKSDEVSHGE